MRLNEVLEDSSYWQGAPAALRNAIESRTNNSISYYHGCRSRSLAVVLNRMTRYYNTINPYKVLLGLCSLMLGDKQIKIASQYNTISSEQAETITLSNIIADLPTPRPDSININFYHIAKGKSFLKKCLDESTIPLNRVKKIEALCIENTSHFVRVYVGLGAAPNDITVFSDNFTQKLVQTILIMIPNILNIAPITKDELIAAGYPEDSLEAVNINGAPQQLYNQRATCLINFFEYLYALYQDKHSIDSDEVKSNIKQTLTILLTQFSDKFDWVSKHLNSFTARLAKVKNDNAARYFNNELETCNSNIKRLETDLSIYYDRKAKAQRALTVNKNASEEDVKPFIDTINNTKAIEVISASENNMILRITAPLQYFNESDFEAYERNTRSDYNQLYQTYPTLKRILHKIFVTREYKLLVQGVIKLALDTRTYTNNILEAHASSELSDYNNFPNPHLYHHDCWNAAKTEIDKNICEGNYELVVMQMVAAVQSVNVAEHPSFVNGLLHDFRSASYSTLVQILDKDNVKHNWTDIIAIEQQLQKEEQIKEAEEKIASAKENNSGYTQVVISEEEITENEAAEETVNTIHDAINAQQLDEVQQTAMQHFANIPNDGMTFFETPGDLREMATTEAVWVDDTADDDDDDLYDEEDEY